MPLKNLCIDVIKLLGLDSDQLRYSAKSQVFYDNSGALNISKCPRMTPVSKCFAVKYHWFRDNIHNCECTVENIGGDFQKADKF